MPLWLGTANAYLVTGARGRVLLDAGNIGQAGKFARIMRKRGVNPERVALIAVTHAHTDHVGSLASIREICGCPVAVHRTEAEYLSRGWMDIAPGTAGWSRAAARVGNTLGRASIMHYRPVTADILVDDELGLYGFGVDGRLIHTPGHTHGSMSLILDDGRAFIGDLAVNRLPLWEGPVIPPFAVDLGQVAASWRRLLTAGARILYPAHGRPFHADVLRRYMRKLKGR